MFNKMRECGKEGVGWKGDNYCCTQDGETLSTTKIDWNEKIGEAGEGKKGGEGRLEKKTSPLRENAGGSAALFPSVMVCLEPEVAYCRCVWVPSSPQFTSELASAF